MTNTFIINSENCVLGLQALDIRPASSMLMHKIVLHASTVDHFIAIMFSSLLNGSENEAFDIFHSSFDLAPRKRFILSIAEKKLPKELVEEIKKFFDLAGRRCKLRHSIAHGLWGISELYPADMLLIDQVEYNKSVCEKVRNALWAESHENMKTYRVTSYNDIEFRENLNLLDELCKKSYYIISEIGYQLNKHILQRHPAP